MKSWKVPFRQVYAPPSLWLKATLWCHVVIRVWPRATELGAHEWAKLNS